MVLAAGSALASAPERSPWPVARPVVAAAPGIVPVARPVAVAPRVAPLLPDLDAEAAALALRGPVGMAEPAPVVRAAEEATPRPQSRPELLEVDIATQGSFAPVRLALRPAARPEGLRPAPAVARALVPVSPLAVAQSPLPPVRPEAARNRFIQQATVVVPQPPRAGTTGQAGGQLCGVAGLEGYSIPAVVANVQGCGVANPVRVRAVDGVRLSQSAILDCETARALHAWVSGGLKPAVGRLGGGVAELRVAAHYVCRTRNHRPGGPISEHGRGRAIDISAVRLNDGQVMDVLRHWRHGTYGPVLRAAHRAACGPFNTTLGPGSDGMHEDHFHYDTRRGGRFCR